MLNVSAVGFLQIVVLYPGNLNSIEKTKYAFQMLHLFYLPCYFHERPILVVEISIMLMLPKSFILETKEL